MLPKIAYDVITAVQATSIIPILSSQQTVEDEQGLVWFKTTRAENTRGNITAGDILTDPRQQVKTPNGYASNFISNEDSGSTIATGTADYNFTLDAIPLRSESLTVTVEDFPGVFAKDQGDGTLLGTGVFGTVNYVTGAVFVTVADSAALNGKKIFASYQQNYELSVDIPQLQNPFASKLIKTRIYALKGTIGLMQSYAMKKRLGMNQEDIVAETLVSEINKEIGGDLVRIAFANAVGTTTFDKTPPANVSYFDHEFVCAS